MPYSYSHKINKRIILYLKLLILGTKNLEDSIKYVAEMASQFKVGFDEIQIPKWKRGKESAWLISPRPMPLRILGLGFSGATNGSEGLKADIIVVRNFKELEAKSSQVSTEKCFL